MALNNESATSSTANFTDPKNIEIDKLISLEECKHFLGKFDLNDQKVLAMRNILIGIADKTISSYLNEFI